MSVRRGKRGVAGKGPGAPAGQAAGPVRFNGAPGAQETYYQRMQTPSEVRTQWRYLRDLLIEQLGRFESGAMKLHEAGIDVSPEAIATLKRRIRDFDQMISRSEGRE